MAQLLNIKIDVTKVNKGRLYRGKKGTYLDLVVSINDEPDQYGNNVSAWEGQTEQERKAKTDRNFLGNGKIIWTGTHSQPVNQAQAADSQPDYNRDEDDLPF